MLLMHCNRTSWF